MTDKGLNATWDVDPKIREITDLYFWRHIHGESLHKFDKKVHQT